MASVFVALMRRALAWTALLVVAGWSVAFLGAGPVLVAQQRTLPVPAQTDGGLGGGGTGSSGGCGDLCSGPTVPGGSVGGAAPAPAGNGGAPLPVGRKPTTSGDNSDSGPAASLGGGGGGGAPAGSGYTANSSGSSDSANGSGGGSDSAQSSQQTKRDTSQDQVQAPIDPVGRASDAGAGASGHNQCGDNGCVTAQFIPTPVIVAIAVVLGGALLYVGLRIVSVRLRRWVE